MKSIIVSLSTLLISAALMFGCKKKEETPAPAAPINNAPPKHVNIVTAKVNNIDWSMKCTDEFCAYSISKFLDKYDFGGQTAFNTPYSAIHVILTYTSGIVNLTRNGNYVGRYTDNSGTSF